MEVAALVISIVASVASILSGFWSRRLSRHSNTLPVLVELFREHRGERLAEARRYVRQELPEDVGEGLGSLPRDKEELVRDLAWFYDNIGALVAHDIVDFDPVAGYLGGSALETGNRLEPLIEVERRRRAGDGDPQRWQEYFENMAAMLRALPPEKARQRQPNWVLASER